MQITGHQLLDLKEKIAKHFSPSHWHDLGVLTDMHDLVDGHPRLLRSLSFGDDDYGGCVLTVLKQIVEAKPSNYKTITDYLARIYPEDGVGENVSSATGAGRQIVFRPEVFKVPEEALDANLVSIMMPFNAGTQATAESIKAAAAAAGFTCQRADDLWKNSVLIQDIFELIFRSYVVVCDFSGRNPNVFYEAGIAHTLGKHVIPITQSSDDIPFDLKHHRYIVYLNNAEGRAKLQMELTKRLEYLSSLRSPPR